jgi:photosystem II stability/assembly factor-like uncharacterized protein
MTTYWLTLTLLAAALIGCRGREVKPVGETRTADVHSLAFDPTDRSTLYFGHYDGILVSRDLGATWTPGTLTGTDAMGLAMPLGGPYYAAGHFVFYKSTDGGVTWQPADQPGGQADIHGFGANPSRPAQVFAQVAGQGVWRSDDAGLTWQPTGSGLPASAFGLTVGPGDPPAVYVGVGDQPAVYRSSDGGQTWQRAASAGLASPPMSLSVDPSGALLAATEAGVFKSADQGESLARLGNLPSAAAVAVKPDDPRTIVAVDAQGQGLCRPRRR